MIIHRINFPIYDILIYFSLVVGSLYIYFNFNKKEYDIGKTIVFFLLFLFIPILLGKIYTMLENPGSNFFRVGVTGYGGLIGVILAAFIYCFLYKNKSILKYAVISLPLTYSFAKLACFFNGCCIGIPYNGPFAVTYIFRGTHSFFPVQLLETFSFIFLFMFCNKHHNHKNIIYITLLLTFTLKFLLDFFRYDHIHKFISNNQIASIILCIITIFVYFIRKQKYLS